MWKKIIGASIVGACTVVYVSQFRPVSTSWLKDENNDFFVMNSQLVPKTSWDYNWDFRESKTKNSSKTDDEKMQNLTSKQSKKKSCRHLILIRHGQYNLDGETDAERKLTELGRKQATATGKRLCEMNIRIDNYVKSTMTRAQETGELILAQLKNVGDVTNSSLLEEGSPFPPEPQIKTWKQPDYKFFQDHARIEAAFRKYFYRPLADQDGDTYTVLVCHGNVIRYMLCRALQIPPEAWLRLSINHGSITMLSIGSSGRVIMRSYNDTGFMPPHLITKT